jgi:hypothetical protein
MRHLILLSKEASAIPMGRWLIQLKIFIFHGFTPPFPENHFTHTPSCSDDLKRGGRRIHMREGWILHHVLSTMPWLVNPWARHANMKRLYAADSLIEEALR